MSLYCKRIVTAHAPSSSRIVGTYSGAFSYQIITQMHQAKERKRSLQNERRSRVSQTTPLILKPPRSSQPFLTWFGVGGTGRQPLNMYVYMHTCLPVRCCFALSSEAPAGCAEAPCEVALHLLRLHRGGPQLKPRKNESSPPCKEGWPCFDGHLVCNEAGAKGKPCCWRSVASQIQRARYGMVVTKSS